MKLRVFRENMENKNSMFFNSLKKWVSQYEKHLALHKRQDNLRVGTKIRVGRLAETRQ